MKLIRLIFLAAVIGASLLPNTDYISASFNSEDVPVGQVASTQTCNDPYYSRQWALRRMPQPAVGSESNQVIVAILDTGIEVDHEDLINKVIDNVNFSGSTTSDDRDGHGTHIAGIIAAEKNNGIGITGVASNVKLLNIKVAEDNGTVWATNIARGIIWATDHGAQVINVSLVVSTTYRPMESAVNYALDHGVVLVAAAGNKKGITYPSAYSDVIAVAATTPESKIWNKSNDGDFISAYAPGASIFSTFPGDKYQFKSGTSMATAFVSAEVAQVIHTISDHNQNGRIGDEAREAMKLLFPKPN